MISKMPNNFSLGLRYIAFALALFFVVLAIFDGFEEVEEIEYCGEFIAEVEYDYLDFPTSISRPSGGKSTSLAKFQYVRDFDRIIKIFIAKYALLTKPPQEIFHLSSAKDIIFRFTILSNAP
ncbi:hypothetical protein EF405_11225 [Cyclobacteriaceae bacterium YHN15]|jgi:hypothetical protein|nr:hypothetical protein EF405_11225 [Cyclobacteriaceae bacterium YHN15]